MLTILSYFVVISSGRLRFYKTFLARDEQSALKGRQADSDAEVSTRRGAEWAGLAYPKFLEFLVRSRLGYTKKSARLG